MCDNWYNSILLKDRELWDYEKQTLAAVNVFYKEIAEGTVLWTAATSTGSSDSEPSRYIYVELTSYHHINALIMALCFYTGAQCQGVLCYPDRVIADNSDPRK